MQTKLDEAKAELLARAARVADNSPGGGVGGPGGGLRVHLAEGAGAGAEDGAEAGRTGGRATTCSSPISSATTCTRLRRT